MPMQPRPIAETSRLLFPRLRFCIFLFLFAYSLLIVFPGRAPVFVRICGLHDKLISGHFVDTRKIFSDEASYHGTLHMKGERVRVLVDLVAAEGSFVAALRILHCAGLATGLRVAV